MTQNAKKNWITAMFYALSFLLGVILGVNGLFIGDWVFWAILLSVNLVMYSFLDRILRRYSLK